MTCSKVRRGTARLAGWSSVSAPVWGSVGGVSRCRGDPLLSWSGHVGYRVTAFIRFVSGSDVAVPLIQIARHPTAEKIDHEWVIDDVDLDTVRPQQLFIASEIDGIRNNHARNFELDDGAGAHHTWAERGVQCGFAPATEQAGIGQAIGLAMQGYYLFLLSLVVALCDLDTSPGEGSADGDSILAGAPQRLGYRYVQKMTINLIHDALPVQLNPSSAIRIASGPTLTGPVNG